MITLVEACGTAGDPLKLMVPGGGHGGAYIPSNIS